MYKGGRLQRRLIIRMILLMLVIVLAFVTTLINVIFRNLPIIPVVLFIGVGYAFGYFIMSRSLALTWDEYRDTITVKRFDIVGIFVIGVYYAIWFATEDYISRTYTNIAFISGYIVAMFFGAVLGRFIGTIKRIHQLSMSDDIPRI